MSKANAAQDGQGDIVSDRARQVLDKVLAAATNPEQRAETTELIAEQLMSLGKDLVPALGEALTHTDAKRRIVAAWILSKLAEREPFVARCIGTLKRAAKILVDALAQNDSDEMVFACVSLASGGVPQPAIPQLKRLLEHPDLAIAVHAAAALSWLGEAVVPAIPVLTTALRQGDPAQGHVAAAALARLAVRTDEAVLLLVRLVGEVPPCHLYSVLLALRDAGPAAAAASGQLTSIVTDATVAGLIRAGAAEALGSVAPGDKSTRQILYKLLRENDWQVIDGSLRGLDRSGGVPSKALPRLRELLHSADVNYRRVAGHGLRMLGKHAEPALDELIEALCQESDRDILLELADACAALGPVSVEPLCTVVRHGGFQRMGAASVALLLLGRVAAQEVARTIVGDKDEIVRSAGIAVLRGMKSDAKPALSVLAELFPGLTNERAAEVLVLFSTHPDAAEVVAPVMLNCFLGRSGEIAELAGKLLEKMGSAAIPALESRLAIANDRERVRIEELFGRLRPENTPGFERLLKLNADSELLLFIFVAEVIQREEPIGFREVGKRLESMEPVKAMNLPTSEAALRLMLGVLQQGLGLSLINQVTRGRCLTLDGRELAGEAREYLRCRGFCV